MALAGVMETTLDQVDWTAFTGRPDPTLENATAASVSGRSVLVTGAAGSIGSALAQTLGRLKPRRLLLLDQAEEGLVRLVAPLEIAGVSPDLVLGDLRDRALLEELFTRHPLDTVFHAAACKHVPLLETNPFPAVSVNACGTHALLEAAARAQVRSFVHVSTDKAVDPASILGASKRLAELLALTTPRLRVQVVRLGNVLGSTGSLGTVLWEQMRRGLPLTLTDPAATRFFLTLNEVVLLLLQALAQTSASALWVPDTMGAPRPVADLLHFLARQNGVAGALPVRHIGLRPGDKLTEQLLGEQESYASPSDGAALRQVLTPLPERAALLQAVDRLELAVRTRDLPVLLRTLCAAVSSYRPSPALAAAATEPTTAGATV